MTITTLARGVGQGLAAGLAGTAAMTVSSTVEMKVRRRAASTAPSKAAQKALGIERFTSAEAEQRFSTLVHWAYGTGWGAARGALRALGMGPSTATAGHFVSVWGSALVTLPTLDVAPPVTMWGGKEVAIDVWHHVVYTVAAAIAYEALESRAS
jgi:hypothetical protein